MPPQGGSPDTGPALPEVPAEQGPGRGSVRGAAAGYGPVQGPRQEYLDAFEGLDTSGTTRSRDGQSWDVRTPEADAGGDAAAADTGGSRRRAPGGRSRTLVGIAAAAVTTVLAVVVAGQVASVENGQDKPSKGGVETGRVTGDGKDAASRSAQERAGAPAGETAQPSYEDRMAESFPIDPGKQGTGEFRTIPGHEEGPDGRMTYRYRVDIEKGLSLDGDLFAEAVHRTLNDERSWAHDGERSFERVSGGEADFVITLASPPTTDEWCAKSGLDTSEQKVSCDSAVTDRVMINGYRWARGAKTYGQERMTEYRQMLINHEVGHRIGRGHVGCPEDGAKAPVMMQQTKYLTTGGATCRPNAWVFPDA